MASITNRQWNAPTSLLDRLTQRSADDVSVATLDRGELPLMDIEAAIARDLSWLLNTTSLGATMDLSRWPNIRRSVLNFGIPVLTGRLIENSDGPTIEALIKKAIETYEPRLRRGSVSVQAISDNQANDQRTMKLRICGEYAQQNVFIPVEWQAAIDFETGRLELRHNASR